MTDTKHTRPRVPQKMPLRCHACGSEDGYAAVKKVRPVEFKGEAFDIHYEANECLKCRHTVLSNLQLDSRAKLTIEAYQKKHQLLTARELIARRKAIGFATQLGFVDAVSLVALPTLKRIEAGMHVQDPTTDFVLRNALAKAEEKYTSSKVFALLREELPAPMVSETTTKVGVYSDSSYFRNIWSAALPLAACVTIVASTEPLVKQKQCGGTPFRVEVLTGC